jgi:DNA-binding response OmpR family regulator
MSDSGKLEIAIVDDDPEMIDMMTTLLTAEGHTVRSSVAGIPALSEIAADKPDCVLTDLMMSALDGMELCREIRKRKSLNKTVIIMVSARDRDAWRERALAAGANDFISKPIDPASFAGQVEAIVAGVNEAGSAVADGGSGVPPVSL